MTVMILSNNYLIFLSIPDARISYFLFPKYMKTGLFETNATFLMCNYMDTSVLF